MNRRSASLAPALVLALAVSPAALRAEGPSASELPAAPAAPSADACARLTSDALSGAEASLGALASAAAASLAARGEGAYPGAMKKAADYFTAAGEKVRSLRAWLTDAGLVAPHVSNTSGAYNVAGYAREAIGQLDTGRHWASVATAYDRAPEGRQLLADAAKAHDVLADLQSNGLTCYVSAYVP